MSMHDINQVETCLEIIDAKLRRLERQKAELQAKKKILLRKRAQQSREQRSEGWDVT